MLNSFSKYVPPRLLVVSVLALAGLVLIGIEGSTAPNPSASISIADTQSSVKTGRDGAGLATSSSGAWTSLTNLNTQCVNHTATLLPNGKVLVAGGQADGGLLASAELYDPATNSWSFTGSMLAARAVHTATLLQNGKVLIAGGHGNTQPLENSTLRQQEFNRAFVLMQYFGYLRRNPFEPPEPGQNFDGYNFWLNKLNQFNGNFVNAEMVKAFIISGEYRHRFGP